MEILRLLKLIWELIILPIIFTSIVGFLLLILLTLALSNLLNIIYYSIKFLSG